MCVPENICMGGYTGNPHRRQGGLFYARRRTYDRIKSSTMLRKKRGMENLVLNIFCSMTLFTKMINYGNISKKLILGTFTSLSSFSNVSILRGKISNMLFHYRTHGFWQGEGGDQRSLENDFRVLLGF